MPLHPETAFVLDLIKEAGRPPMQTLTPAEAREVSAKSRAVLQPPPPEVAAVEDLTCPGPSGEIRLRHYRGLGTAPEAVLPALVYFHGGGWVIGDLDSHDQVCRTLANAAQCAVVAVDYRMAPEHVFPAAVNDSAAAYAWVVGNAAALRIDPQRIAVGGDSAGGNLATVVSIMARDGAFPLPCFQWLVYPATDLTASLPSYERMADGPFVLTTPTMKWFRDHYLSEPAQQYDWRASPLRAASLAGLPPALVLTCHWDPLCDEGILYAQRLGSEGVLVQHVHMNDQMHAFLTMGRFIGASDMAIRHAALALRDVWRERV
jgi:acetyl esterase